MKFIIFGIPKPMPRPRVIQRSGKVWTYVPKTEYKEKIQWVLKDEMIKSKWYKITSNIYLIVRLYNPNKLADIDNLIKMILDACQGICFNNDRQVRELNVKIIHDKGEKDRTEIEILLEKESIN